MRLTGSRTGGETAGSLAACTIVTKDRLSYARVWSESFRRHHPDASVFVLLADRPDGYFEPSREPFEVETMETLGVRDLEQIRFAYGPHALSTAAKPLLLLHLLDDRRYDRVLYLDSDTRLYAPLTRALEMLDDADVVLVPHALTPLPPDGRRPQDSDVVLAGTYNGGFVAVRSCAGARSFLRWWRDHLAAECVELRDQLWLNLAPTLFAGVRLLRDRGYNVAYWNLHERWDLSGRDGSFAFPETPLAFFHFSGLDPARPEGLSRHQDRYALADLPVPYRELVGGYVAALVAEGLEDTARWPFSFGRFADGVRIPEIARQLYRRERRLGREWGDPFAPRGGFREWLMAPGDLLSRVPRLLEEIYRGRVDLKFRSCSVDEQDELLRWACAHAGPEYGLDDYFVSAFRRCLDEVPAPAPGTGEGP